MMAPWCVGRPWPSSARHDADPVAVAPDAAALRVAVHVEVAVVQPLAAVVAPQEQRHRRHRHRAHQLAHLVDQRPAVAVGVGV
jgi:hypothetical protein